MADPTGVDLSEFVDQSPAQTAAAGPSTPVAPAPKGVDLSEFVDATPNGAPSDGGVNLKSILNPMPSLEGPLHDQRMSDAMDYYNYGPSMGKNIDPKAYQEDLKDQQASNPGLDDTSMAADVNAWMNTIPADKRTDVANSELLKTGTTAAGGLLGLTLAGGVPEIAGLGATGINSAAGFAADVGSAGLNIAKAVGKSTLIPSAEEMGGWAVKKGLHAAGITNLDPWVDRLVLLAQLASRPGAGAGEKIASRAVGGVNALEQVKDALKSNGNQAAPAEPTPAPEPDPTTVDSPYTTGFQGQQYNSTSASPILMPQ